MVVVVTPEEEGHGCGDCEGKEADFLHGRLGWWREIALAAKQRPERRMRKCGRLTCRLRLVFDLD